MSDLLTLALKAHGGIERWKQIRKVTAQVSVAGALWEAKGQAGALQKLRIEALLHEQRLVTDFPDANERSIFTSHGLVYENKARGSQEFWENPRALFLGQRPETPWDKRQTAYFNSYALWTYLTIPFVYTYPGFAVEELTSWEEDGEQWRPLKASFPEGIVSHTLEQVSYFGLTDFCAGTSTPWTFSMASRG
jgi:hypothetical protein